MRNAFAKQITKLATQNKKIILLSGDIGNRLFDNFKIKCKNQFYNCGVAENNMVGVAAGLAKQGFIPFVYTIAPFLVARSYEQIKLDVCYQNLNVKIVGTGAGLSYSRLGTTHHSLDDISLMKNIPNMNVICPGDPFEVTELTKQISKIKKPFYLRLGKKGEPVVNKDNNIKILKLNCINKGKNICIISIGNMLGVGSELRHELYKKKVNGKSYIWYDEDQIDLVNYIIDNYSDTKEFNSSDEYFEYTSKLDNKLFDENIVEKLSENTHLEKWLNEFGLDKIKKELHFNYVDVLTNCTC